MSNGRESAVWKADGGGDGRRVERCQPILEHNDASVFCLPSAHCPAKISFFG
jgi:hypothetical protein